VLVSSICRERTLLPQAPEKGYALLAETKLRGEEDDDEGGPGPVSRVGRIYS
jgi:hypothetical protein